MRIYINDVIEIKNISIEKYDKLIEFLENNNIDYEQTDYEEFTIDERSEDEKYDDWLWTLADNRNDELKLGD